jgi:hypothetical protein
MHERPHRPIRIGQTECDPPRSVSARTFVTRVAFTQAATLSRASREISREMDDILPESLAISRMTPVSQLQDIEKDLENEVAIAQSQGHTGASSSSSSRALGTPALG